MGETVSLLNGANLRMHRMVFCIVIIISVARHTVVSAYLEFYPAFRRSVKEPPLPPESNWDRDPVPEFNSEQNQKQDESFQRIAKAEETTLPETTSVYDDNFDVDKGVEFNDKEISEKKISSPSVLKTLLTLDTVEDIIFLVSAGFSMVALVTLLSILLCWYKINKDTKAAADVEYPAYGVTGPNKELSPTGDRRLAQSAQMYHYQHQKQQIIAMESSRANNERRGSVSEADSDEENEEGDYTVYECPGLAATGEMEVKNPLFQDDPTPATAVQSNGEPTIDEDKK